MRFLKYIVLFNFLISISLYCLDVSALTIRAITLGQMTGDKLPREFSMVINIVNSDAGLRDWKLGFYMPKTFAAAGKVNSNLTMKLCDQLGHCVPLIYAQSKITEPDLSAGYTTVLAPKTPFPLEPERIYTIYLLHNNQGNPKKYSSAPQNFFLISQGKVNNLRTEKETYHFLDYHPEQIQSLISQHIMNNWNESAPIAAEESSIIPNPVSEQKLDSMSDYQLKDGVIIHNLFTSDVSAKLLRDYLREDLKINASIDHKNSDKDITIRKIADPSLINNNPEGYVIQVQSQRIIIKASHDTGIFYALQTLRQLWNQNRLKSGVLLHPKRIIDYPRFRYRGILLDVSRHYFTVKEIEKLIDVMASQKLNTLHIHFSDDEAFRINLPDFPKLSSIGAKRGLGQSIGPMMFLQANLDPTNTKKSSYPQADTIYDYSYGKQAIQELIRYANQRQITIIPELDLPAHARALIKSMPQSFIDPEDHSSFVSAQGYTDNVLPISLYEPDNVFYKDINKILNQVTQMFSGQTTLYAKQNELSIGGDEVNPEAWKQNLHCTKGDALAKAQNFLLQLALHNNAIVFSGWQEVIQNSYEMGSQIIPTNQMGHIYVWSKAKQGISQAIQLMNHHYSTVLVLADENYFDLGYTPDIKEPGFAWAIDFSDTHSALSSAQSASKVLKQTYSPNQSYLAGLEGALWSECLVTFPHLLYMALPKIAGLAEASWSPETKTIMDGQLAWRSLAHRLGCGKTGFLFYLTQRFGITYRGYPQGIISEVPADQC